MINYGSLDSRLLAFSAHRIELSSPASVAAAPELPSRHFTSFRSLRKRHCKARVDVLYLDVLYLDVHREEARRDCTFPRTLSTPRSPDVQIGCLDNDEASRHSDARGLDGFSRSCRRNAPSPQSQGTPIVEDDRTNVPPAVHRAESADLQERDVCSLRCQVCFGGESYRPGLISRGMVGLWGALGEAFRSWIWTRTWRSRRRQTRCRC